jgi:hypothetical protein
MINKNLIRNNVLSYHGPINIDLVSFMSNYIKQHLPATNPVISKVYKVLIELMQNVSYYSAYQFNSMRSFGSGVGWFSIDEYELYFTIKTGNKILSEHGPLLVKHSQEINRLSEEELRDLKRKTRSQASVRDIGAHIGLIQTGLITGNEIDLKIEPYDAKHSYFTITAIVNKK